MELNSSRENIPSPSATHIHSRTHALGMPRSVCSAIKSVDVYVIKGQFCDFTALLIS